MSGGALLVGAARVDVTPPLSVPYLGFQPRQAYFRGVHDPLEARAALFRTSETSACILSIDAIGIDNRMLGPGRSFVRELRGRIEERLGIPGAHVAVSSTHAHATPETLGITRSWELPAMRAWMETLLDRLTAVAGAADRQAVPCTLGVGSERILGVAYNRRPLARGLSPGEQAERGLLDPEIGVLVCRDDRGEARCLIANFACHAVTVQVQPLVSADFPGVACRLVEEALPGRPPCLYLQGAAGNINPVGDDTRDFGDVRRIGLAVGSAVLKAAALLPRRAERSGLPTPVRVASRVVELPPRQLPDRELLEARVAAARERAAREDRAGGESGRRDAAASLRAAREALDLVDRFSDPQPAELQALRLGDLAVACSPGEMFAEWGLAVKRASPAPHTFVAELVNGWNGYLLSAGSFAEGGYEAGLGTWTQTSEAGAREVAQGLQGLVAGLWT